MPICFLLVSCSSLKKNYSNTTTNASTRKLATSGSNKNSDIYCTVKPQNPGAEITYGVPIFSGKVFPNGERSSYLVLDNQEKIMSSFNGKRSPVSERFTSQRGWKNKVSVFISFYIGDDGFLNISHGLYKISEQEFYGTKIKSKGFKDAYLSLTDHNDKLLTVCNDR